MPRAPPVITATFSFRRMMGVPWVGSKRSTTFRGAAREMTAGFGTRERCGMVAQGGDTNPASPPGNGFRAGHLDAALPLPVADSAGRVQKGVGRAHVEPGHVRRQAID